MESFLPPELEREIFELCAASDRSSAKSLILVAKRVHLWIEPLIYRVLFYYEHERPHCPPSNPLLLQYANQGVITPRLRAVCSYAHSILLQGTTSGIVTTILQLCINLQGADIWLMEGDHTCLRDLIPIIGAPVSLLSINTSLLFETINSKIRVDALTLRNITHLDAIAVTQDIWMEEWRALGLLPKLSHLAFSLDDRMCKHIVESILTDTTGFRTLKLLVHFGRHRSSENSRVTDDKRFVELSSPRKPIEDWIQGTRTGYDFWAMAERIQEGWEAPSSPDSQFSDLDLAEDI